MNWYLDVFAHEENDSIPIHAKEEKLYLAGLREGACEDDKEVKCPFIDMLPDESGKENGSPLNFNRGPESILLSPHEIDQQIQLAYQQGL